MVCYIYAKSPNLNDAYAFAQEMNDSCASIIRIGHIAFPSNFQRLEIQSSQAIENRETPGLSAIHLYLPLHMLANVSRDAKQGYLSRQLLALSVLPCPFPHMPKLH
jgi:hypothetical protein